MEIDLNDLLPSSPWDCAFEKKVKGCFRKLCEVMALKKLTLSKIFNIYDLDKSGSLELN